MMGFLTFILLVADWRARSPDKPDVTIACSAGATSNIPPRVSHTLIRAIQRPPAALPDGCIFLGGIVVMHFNLRGMLNFGASSGFIW